MNNVITGTFVIVITFYSLYTPLVRSTLSVCVCVCFFFAMSVKTKCCGFEKNFLENTHIHSHRTGCSLKQHANLKSLNNAKRTVVSDRYRTAHDHHRCLYLLWFRKSLLPQCQCTKNIVFFTRFGLSWMNFIPFIWNKQKNHICAQSSRPLCCCLLSQNIYILIEFAIWFSETINFHDMTTQRAIHRIISKIHCIIPEKIEKSEK